MNDQVLINIRMGLATCGHWKLEELQGVMEWVVGKPSGILPVKDFKVVNQPQVIKP